MPRVFVNLLQTTGTKGGIEVYAKELYRALAALTSDFEFVGFASRELAATEPDWFPGELINSGISGENRITWALGELFAVSRAAKRVGADLIHGPAMFGPAATKIPLVISIHDLLYFSHPELIKSKIVTGPVKAMERVAVRNATRVITISDYSRRAIEKYLRYPSDRIDLIPLAGRNIGGSAASTQKRADDLFIAIGQRSPYKDFAGLILAWAEIPPSERPRLVVTGSHGADPLTPLVARLGLEEWVDLRSWVSEEELNALFDTATALIDPTIATGFSLPALEAMSRGVPVLMTDSEVFREVGADAAHYFAPHSPASLAAEVSSLRRDPSALARMSSAGRARAAEFSWERVARETSETFTRALSQPRAS
jgi:glycosyltransferase involved in cell wall biosynthesis